MMFGRTMLRVSVVAGVFLMMTACGGSKKEAAQEGFAPVPRAEVVVNKKTVEVPAPLTIVLGAEVNDIVELPGAWGKMKFQDYRAALNEALSTAFTGNFSEIKSSDTVFPQGYVLLIQRAEMQQSSTIRYHGLLSYNGNEFIDVSGETQGRIIIAGGMYGSGAKAAQETLMKEAISKMCEGIYDGIFRNEKLGFNFWTEDAPHLKDPGAGAAEGGGAGEGEAAAPEEGAAEAAPAQ